MTAREEAQDQHTASYAGEDGSRSPNSSLEDGKQAPSGDPECSEWDGYRAIKAKGYERVRLVGGDGTKVDEEDG